jgi:hypothetical protein
MGGCEILFFVTRWFLCYAQLMDLKPAEPQPTNSVRHNGVGGSSVATKNLHVSNLSRNSSKDSILALFEVHATVLDVSMKEGFCFVNTASREDASRALQALQGRELDGMKLSINFAKVFCLSTVDRCGMVNLKRHVQFDPLSVQQDSDADTASQALHHPQRQFGGCGGGNPHGNQGMRSQTASMLLSGQWVSMNAAFAEDHVRDNDGRLWEYVGTDEQVGTV